MPHRYFARNWHLDRAKRIWYLSPMRAAKVQASLRIRAVSPEPSLLAHTSSESRGTFRQKARSLAPLNVWACTVKICHDGMLEDTNSLDGAHLSIQRRKYTVKQKWKKKELKLNYLPPCSHWSILTSACRWQHRLAVRYIAGFLEQNDIALDKLTEMICIFISVDVNTKQKNIPLSTRSIKVILF